MVGRKVFSDRHSLCHLCNIAAPASSAPVTTGFSYFIQRLAIAMARKAVFALRPAQGNGDKTRNNFFATDPT